MTEMVLALPILMAVLLLTFYFGREVVHVQVVQTVDRYEAWRRAAQADENSSSPWSAMQTASGGSIAVTVQNHFPDDAQNALQGYLQEPWPDAASLMSHAFEAFPSGRRAVVSASHASGVSAWPTLSGSVRHQHTRLDGDWTYFAQWEDIQGQPWRDFAAWTPAQPWPVASDYWGPWPYWTSHGSWIRRRNTTNQQPPPWMMRPASDAFFTTLDDSINELILQGNGLAGVLRNQVYRGQPTTFTGPGVRIE